MFPNLFCGRGLNMWESPPGPDLWERSATSIIGSWSSLPQFVPPTIGDPSHKVGEVCDLDCGRDLQVSIIGSGSSLPQGGRGLRPRLSGAGAPSHKLCSLPQGGRGLWSRSSITIIPWQTCISKMDNLLPPLPIPSGPDCNNNIR